MAAWMIPAAILGSALLGSRASSSAASTQAAAADRAAELQREQFERQVELQEPWRQAGIAAQNRLLTLLGINPNVAASGGGGGGGGGGGFFGSALAGIAPVVNAMTSSAPSRLAVDTTSPEFGKYGKAFSETNWTVDPGYAFRLAEGQKALERSAAARGGLLSGGAGKALTRYGQEMGSQEYQNAFNRYYAERNAALNPLQSLAGVGQTTAQQLGAAGQTMASNVGQAQAAAAQARASGYMGGTNAITGGLGTYLNYSQNQAQNALLAQALGRGGGYTSMPTYSPNYFEGQFNPAG